MHEPFDDLGSLRASDEQVKVTDGVSSPPVAACYDDSLYVAACHQVVCQRIGTWLGNCQTVTAVARKPRCDGLQQA